MKRSILGIILIAVGLVSLVYLLYSGGDSLFNRLFSLKELKLEETADTSSIRRIHIQSGSTNVSVVRGKTASAVIRLQGKGSQSVVDGMSLDVTNEGDALRIHANGSKERWFIPGWKFVKLTVELPDKMWDNVTLEASSGNIELADLSSDQIAIDGKSGNLSAIRMRAGELAAELRSGNMDLRQIESGTIDLKLSSGNIELAKFKAEQLNFETSSGNAKLIDGHAKLIGKATSGNINLEASSLQHDADLQTQSGNIRINLDKTPASLAIDYRASSGNGKIGMDGFVYNVKSHDRDVIKGSFGKGEVKLNVRTASGNFSLN